MNATTICAILVNYNGGKELRTALRSLRDELQDLPWEAIVIDNNSVDGSAEIALEFAPNARLIRNTTNVGFGRGVNQGLAASSAPLLLIINPDCRLIPGAVETMRLELQRHQSCAIVGPRILNPDGSVQGTARGDPDMSTGLFGRTSLLGRLMPWMPAARRNIVSDTVPPRGESSLVVDWLSGACMLARRDPLTQVNGFDERYFLYWEDADLCRRLRARGYHVRYVPEATAIHRVGYSSRNTRSLAIRAFHQSAYLYYATHVAPGRLRLLRPLARFLLEVRCGLHILKARVRRRANAD